MVVTSDNPGIAIFLIVNDQRRASFARKSSQTACIASMLGGKTALKRAASKI
jgi:hypothetical protein